MPDTNAYLDAASIAAVKDLVMAATNSLEHELITPPKDSYGLPAEVPILIKTGDKTEIISLKEQIEKYRFAPERIKGTAKVETLQSLIDLVNRHKDDETSVIFASTVYPEIALTAVIDYHSVEHDPQFAAHRILYEFPLTEEFKIWINNDGELMEQAKFAAFLEEHAAELASALPHEIAEYEPLFKERFASPNTLITLSRDLEIYAGSKVKRGERLSSGERTVVFEEAHTNGKGEPIEIPGLFIISVPAWLDGEKIRLAARLRYRLGGGTINWAYQIYRWEYFLRNQVMEDLAHTGKETGLPTFLGAPEA